MRLALSDGARAAIMAGLLLLVIIGAVVAEYAIATWRADSIVAHSENQLCTIVRLVTKTPVPKPPDPKSNPSRESSYEFYEAFVMLGKEYGC